MGHHLKDNIILMTSLSKNACRYLKLALVQVLTSNFQKEWLAHQNLTSHDDIVIKLFGAQTANSRGSHNSLS